MREKKNPVCCTLYIKYARTPSNMGLLICLKFYINIQREMGREDEFRITLTLQTIEESGNLTRGWGYELLQGAVNTIYSVF